MGVKKGAETLAEEGDAISLAEYRRERVSLLQKFLP